MGDVVTLVEKAQKTMEVSEAFALQEKLAGETFTLVDLLDQYRRMRKMGSLQSLVEMIPGLKGAVDEEKIDEAGDEARGGDDPVDDADGAAEPPHHRARAPGAHRAGQRHLGVRGQPVHPEVREDVPHDEEDVAQSRSTRPGCMSQLGAAGKN